MFRPPLFVAFVLVIAFSGSLSAQNNYWPNTATSPGQVVPWQNQANPQRDLSSQTDRLRIKPSDASSGRSPSESRANSGPVSVAWTFGSLVFVCLMMFFGAKLFKKKMGLNSQTLPNEVLNLLGRKQLTPTQQIFLVRLGPKVVMIGVGTEGLRALSEITDPVEVDLLTGLCQQQEETANNSQQFLRLFRKSLQTSTPIADPVDDPYNRLRQNLDLQRPFSQRGPHDV